MDLRAAPLLPWCVGHAAVAALVSNAGTGRIDHSAILVSSHDAKDPAVSRGDGRPVRRSSSHAGAVGAAAGRAPFVPCTRNSSTRRSSADYGCARV